MVGDEPELHAIDLVCARMAERFPHVPPATIRRTVDEIYAELDGPIRDFVPVLVEHIARDRLAVVGPVSA
jgi:hypothetical protein